MVIIEVQLLTIGLDIVDLRLVVLELIITDFFVVILGLKAKVVNLVEIKDNEPGGKKCLSFSLKMNIYSLLATRFT